MDKFTEIVTKVNDFVWGPVMLVFLVGTGIFLTLRLRFLPWRNLGSSLKKLFSKESRKKDGEGDISPFSALMTALAATVGTGNIVGCNGYGARRTGCSCMDVDFSGFRHFNKICGMCACRKIQESK